MSITDELREWVTYHYTGWESKRAEGYAIADRIDAEHQKALDEWKAEHGQMWLKGYSECHAELLEGNETLASDLERCGWVRLPKDADGEYIHIGDVLTDDAKFKSEGKVMRLMLEDEGWMVGFGCGGWTEPPIHEWHHYHVPTVEDVLREFADIVRKERVELATISEDTIAEYAAKLRLAREDA